jgi:hypothetical protein
MESATMPKKTGDVNKSAEIRKLLQDNPTAKASEVIAALKGKGITVATSQFYFVKGKVLGRRGRRRKARQMVANVQATMGSNGSVKHTDVVATIQKVKSLALSVGGMKKLRELVEALA